MKKKKDKKRKKRKKRKIVNCQCSCSGMNFILFLGRELENWEFPVYEKTPSQKYAFIDYRRSHSGFIG